MSKKAHEHCLSVAKDTASSLYDVLASLGHQQLNKSDALPLADVLCRSVSGQQLSVKAASTIWSRDKSVCSDPSLVHALQRAPTETLRGCGLSAAKTRAIKGIAQASLNGQLDESALGILAANERSKRLQQRWGVGEWTADMINIFYYRETDIWPARDITAGKTLLIPIRTVNCPLRRFWQDPWQFREI